jgi:hypothetical protein
LTCVLAAVVSLCFVCCGVLFAEKTGRWNPLDPDNELLSFTPSIDGYVDSTSWHDGGDLIANGSLAIVLIRFDSSDFPDVVAQSYLRLAKYSANTVDPELEIHRVIQPWDSSVTLAEVDNPGIFYDDTTEQRVVVPKDSTELLISLDDVFIGEKDRLAYGIVVYAPVELLQLGSVHGPDPPTLLTEPE